MKNINLFKNILMVTIGISFFINCNNDKNIYKMNTRDHSKNLKSKSKNDKKLSVYKPIANSTINQFIDSRKQNEVLSMNLNESHFNVKNTFNSFPAVSYQKERYGDAFLFVPNNFITDAKKMLSTYYKNEKPNYYTYLVPVKDKLKFSELATKTSPCFAFKSGNWINDVKWKKDLKK